jgi:putative FmdB family regulatory protein
MPIYEYKCLKCERKFERLLSISQSESIILSDCCHSETEKLISTTSPPKFKGKGFHSVDYGSKTK